MRMIKNMMAAVLIGLSMTITLDAKSSGFSSSSSRSSSSSSSSRPSSSSSSKSTYSSSSSQSKSSATAQKPDTAKTQTSTRQASAVDTAKYKAAAQNGTAFKTRESAVADFKAKKGSTYTSRYSSEPTTRPAHIPNSYSSGGQTYNVTYNSNQGGYGYTNALGAFIVYDALSDIAMTNRLMAQNNYHVGGPPAVHHSGIGTLGIAFFVVAGVIIISCIFVLFR